MTKLETWEEKQKEIEDKTTKGPWVSMFIGGPLTPKRIEISEVGREGSPHITIKQEQKYIDSGFFKEGDPEFVANARTALPQARKIIRALSNVLIQTGCDDSCKGSQTGKVIHSAFCNVLYAHQVLELDPEKL